MSASRTWSLRINLDEFNALASSVYTDADRALLFQGMTLGFNGGELPDAVPSPFARAHQFAFSTRRETEEFRAKMGANGSRGGRPAHRQDPGEHEPDYGVEEPAGKPEGNQLVNQQVDLLVDQLGYQKSTLTNNHKPINEQRQNEQPQTDARDTPRRFVAPSRDEWLEHCRSSWPMWDHASIHGSWEYYHGNEWRKADGRKVSSWKGCAATSFNGWLARNPNYRKPYADHLAGAKTSQAEQPKEPANQPARMSPILLIQERAKHVG